MGIFFNVMEGRKGRGLRLRGDLTVGCIGENPERDAEDRGRQGLCVQFELNVDAALR